MKAAKVSEVGKTALGSSVDFLAYLPLNDCLGGGITPFSKIDEISVFQ